MKVVQPIWVKQGDYWRIERWEVVAEVPKGLHGKDAIEWAKSQGYRAPVLED